MVTPETSGPPKPVRRPTWAVAAGLVIVVAGVAALLTLTQPDPPPVADATTVPTVPPVEPPSTTSTTASFRVADVVSGPQIEWVGVRDFTDQAVITVMPTGDDFYLFTTQRATYPDWQVSGLEVWRLQDTSWLLMSTLPPDFAPRQVIETGDGFLTLGTELNGAPVAWISQNATEWDRIPLPWEEGTYVSFDNVVATDDLVVIGAVGQKDPALLVAQAVAEHYPHLRGELRDYSDRVPIIVLSVPPFIPVVVVEPEDLGLTASDLQSDWRFDRLTFIGTDGGRRWERVVAAEDDGSWIVPAFKGPGEMIWGRGRGDSGGMFRSPDGLAWEPMNADLPDSMTAWESRVIGVESYDGRGTPSLQTSTDLVFWEDLPVPDVLLPRWGADYWDPVLAAGDGGVALAVRTTEHSTRGRDPVRLERDGYTLFAGPTGLFLLKGATPIIRDWEPAPDLWIPARLTEDGASVIFSDPETRVDFVTFSLAELEELGAGWHEPEPVVIANDRHVLFFSPDGETWTIQDLSGIATAYGPTNIAVGTESMLVVTSDFWSAKVWVGQLPPTP